MRRELENRLIELSVRIIKLCKKMSYGIISQNVISQIIRSSTSAALNYGEAQGAESRRDFIHKTSIVLKELRETHINLKIISQSGLVVDNEFVEQLIDECNQLVSIFHKIIITAKSNLKSSNRKSSNRKSPNQ